MTNPSRMHFCSLILSQMWYVYLFKAIWFCSLTSLSPVVLNRLLTFVSCNKCPSHIRSWLSKLNLAQQVPKEKKPLTDWSNFTTSAPCMMSLSPLTPHKSPQVCIWSGLCWFICLMNDKPHCWNNWEVVKEGEIVDRLEIMGMHLQCWICSYFIIFLWDFMWWPSYCTLFSSLGTVQGSRQFAKKAKLTSEQQTLRQADFSAGWVTNPFSFLYCAFNCSCFCSSWQSRQATCSLYAHILILSVCSVPSLLVKSKVCL